MMKIKVVNVIELVTKRVNIELLKKNCVIFLCFVSVDIH